MLSCKNSERRVRSLFVILPGSGSSALISADDHRLLIAKNGRSCDDALPDVCFVRDVKHDVFHYALHDRSQAARAGILAHGELRDLS